MVVRIEQLGLCGAGKTTFLNKLATKMESDLNLKISYPIKPPRTSIVMSFFKMFFFCLLTEPFVFIHFLFRKKNWWLIKKISLRSAGIRERGDNNCILADSGVLQPFISFEIEENHSNISIPVQCLLKYCPLPNIILNFHVSSSTAMERYEQRGLRGEGQLIRKNSANYFHRAHQLQEKLISYCKKRNISVIDIDSQSEFTDEYLMIKLSEIRKILTDENKGNETAL